MIDAQQRPIQISTSESAGFAGVLNVQVFDNNERLKRAMKMLGMLWGLAAISLFIPIAHWFLVPSFVLAGPIAATMRYRMTEALGEANGRCPSCQQDITLELEASDKLPLWTYCPQCNNSVQLSPRDDTA